MAESDPQHPIAHIDKLKCYEWMLAECASLNSHRQAREDSLIATITQISSAAVLAIPGLFFAADVRLPQFTDSPFLYIGVVGFLLALAASMAEQHYSAVAHAKQIEIVQAYYTRQSAEIEDQPSRQRVRYARRAAYALFTLSLLTSSLGLLTI
ncbi:MAG TPA: hypothetical protein VGD10_08360 [Allosphingosinicella sp.]|uniref:hypothetical protein n=1 Tax=Allosphingosinicella sp. TaxID=2823234 RepID=UPI002ED9F6E0